MPIATQITQVTVHPDGAWITRSGRAPAGVVSVYDLPLLLDATRLEVSVTDGAATDVREVAALLRPKDGERLRVLRGVRFDLLVASREARFQVRYFVEAARWSPTYSLTVSGDQARLRVDALVAQATGEDWTDARLRVCTTSGRSGSTRVGLRRTGPLGPPAIRLTRALWRLMSTGDASPPDWLFTIATAETERCEALRAARLPDGARSIRDGAAPLVLGGGAQRVAADGLWRTCPVEEVRLPRRLAFGRPEEADAEFPAPPMPLPTGPLRVYEDDQLRCQTLLRAHCAITVPRAFDGPVSDDAPTLLGGPVRGADGVHSGALPTLIEASPPISLLAEALGPAAPRPRASIQPPVAPQSTPRIAAAATPVPVVLPVGRRCVTRPVDDDAGEPPAPEATAATQGRARRTGPTTLLALDDLTVDEDPNEHSLYEFLFGTQAPPDPAGVRPLLTATAPPDPVRRAGDLREERAAPPRVDVARRDTRKVRAFG